MVLLKSSGCKFCVIPVVTMSGRTVCEGGILGGMGGGVVTPAAPWAFGPVVAIVVGGRGLRWEVTCVPGGLAAMVR